MEVALDAVELAVLVVLIIVQVDAKVAVSQNVKDAVGVQDAGRLVLESVLVLVIRHVKMVAVVAADHVLIIVMDALVVVKLVELLVLIHVETAQETVQVNVMKLA